MSSARPSETRNALIGTIIATLATEGEGRLTQRRIAAASGRALSVTGYHFASRDAMLEAAARDLLTGWPGPAGQPDHEDPIRRQARHELLLAATWSPAVSAICAAEFDRIFPDPWAPHACADLALGVDFITLACGAGPDEILAQLPQTDRPDAGGPGGGKSARTRQTILDAAISLMEGGGASAVSYRAIADLTGAAQSAPAYHFGSIEGVLLAARQAMFHASRQRYRNGWADMGHVPLSPSGLADVSNAIFIREACEFARASAAHYSVWACASRNASLRQDIRDSVLRMSRAWAARLEPLGRAGLRGGFDMQAHFIGALLRVLACGSRIQDVASFRSDLISLLPDGR